MRDVVIAITAASYSGNKGAAAMLQSSIRQLHKKYGQRLNINLMSVYPKADREQVPWDFVKIVSCKPEQLLFIAFPLSILYWLLSPFLLHSAKTFFNFCKNTKSSFGSFFIDILII